MHNRGDSSHKPGEAKNSSDNNLKIQQIFNINNVCDILDDNDLKSQICLHKVGEPGEIPSQATNEK